MSYDVIVVGGSYAGLSAALALGRARKRVLVVDAGLRRNRFAHAAHGVLGHDGRAPEAIVGDARAELGAYPTVAFADGTAAVAAPGEIGFAVTLADGTAHAAARLILATGVTDELPDLPGLREGWGRSVLHCPYCHGFEVAGRRLGVLAFGPGALHQANLIPEWGPTAFFPNGAVDLPDATRAALAAQGVTVEDGEVTAVLHGPDGLAGIRMGDGQTVPIDALFIGVPTRPNAHLAEQLGCALDQTPLGPVIRVDPTGQTTVPGVFAAGDLALPMKNVPNAVASGFMAGASAHRSLLPPLP